MPERVTKPKCGQEVVRVPEWCAEEDKFLLDLLKLKKRPSSVIISARMAKAGWKRTPKAIQSRLSVLRRKESEKVVEIAITQPLLNVEPSYRLLIDKVLGAVFTSKPYRRPLYREVDIRTTDCYTTFSR